MPARATIDKARDARQARRNGDYLTRLGAMMAPLPAEGVSPNSDQPCDTLVRAVVASQKILADALESGGSRDQAFALLLGILDHEEVVQAVAETVREAPVHPVG